MLERMVIPSCTLNLEVVFKVITDADHKEVMPPKLNGEPDCIVVTCFAYGKLQ